MRMEMKMIVWRLSSVVFICLNLCICNAMLDFQKKIQVVVTCSQLFIFTNSHFFMLDFTYMNLYTYIYIGIYTQTYTAFAY